MKPHSANTPLSMDHSQEIQDMFYTRMLLVFLCSMFFRLELTLNACEKKSKLWSGVHKQLFLFPRIILCHAS